MASTLIRVMADEASMGPPPGPKSAAATLAIAEWPLARRADREICGSRSRAPCETWHVPGLSRSPVGRRAERAAGPDAGSDPASLPTGPSPHDRDTHEDMKEPGQRPRATP